MVAGTPSTLHLRFGRTYVMLRVILTSYILRMWYEDDGTVVQWSTFGRQGVADG
jgi:hypothetical protein